MLTRFFAVILGTTLTLLPVPTLAAEAFTIGNFDVDIEVLSSSRIIVRETIGVDFGGNERHGIYRTIPTRLDTRGNAQRSIRVTDVTVQQNEAVVESEISRDFGGQVEIKIGDPDVLVSQSHIYEISYAVDNALGFFPDHAELYWNVTGTGWATPIESASATVTLPAESPHLQAIAYQGVGGSSQSGRATTEGQALTFQTTRSLDEYEGLTIVAGWPLGIVTQPTTVTRLGWFLTDNGVLLLPILVLLWVIWRVSRYGKDPAGRGTIIPEFAPPKDLSLLEQAALRDERLQPRDIAALIVSWAVDGFITISEPKRGQYELVKRRDLNKRPAWELAFFQSIIGDKSTVALKDLEGTLSSAAGILRRRVFDELVKRGYFVRNPERTRNAYLFAGVALVIASLWFGTSIGWPTVVGLMASGVILLIAGPFMPRRTPEGVRMKERVEGFQLYLRTAERYRLQFAEKEKLFERYLPYAIALGVATLWAKAFSDIATAAPGWYSGYFASHWAATDFARGMEHDLSGSIGSITTAGSGGSGFGGGGVGGGGGGGGGGSW